MCIRDSSYYTWDNVQSANGVAPSASRRDSFRIELSATHLRVCITGNNTGQVYTFRGQSPYCFVDSDMNSIASWGGQAVVMITHVSYNAVSYTHLRAHETPEHLVCRLLLE